MTVTVTIAHIRAAKLCTRGARQWFDFHHFSWSDFITNGMDAETLEATGDALAFKVTAIARGEANG